MQKYKVKLKQNKITYRTLLVDAINKTDAVEKAFDRDGIVVIDEYFTTNRESVSTVEEVEVKYE